MTRKAGAEAGAKHPERRPRSQTRSTPSPRSKASSPPPPPPPQSRGLGSLLRGGAGSILGHVSGITGVDEATAGFERMARSLERGAAFLDRAEAEVGLERLGLALERLEALSELTERREIEEFGDRLQRLLAATEGIERSMRAMTALMERQLAALEARTHPAPTDGPATPATPTPSPRRGGVRTGRRPSP